MRQHGLAQGIQVDAVVVPYLDAGKQLPEIHQPVHRGGVAQRVRGDVQARQRGLVAGVQCQGAFVQSPHRSVATGGLPVDCSGTKPRNIFLLYVSRWNYRTLRYGTRRSCYKWMEPQQAE